MKKFASGLIIGLILSLSITVIASELVVKPNQFPIEVNGTSQNVAAYNINGSTFIGLRDVAKVTDGVVKTDFENGVIKITSKVESKDLALNEPPNNTENTAENDGEYKPWRERIEERRDLEEVKSIDNYKKNSGSKGSIAPIEEGYEQYYKNGIIVVKIDGAEYVRGSEVVSYADYVGIDGLRPQIGDEGELLAIINPSTGTKLENIPYVQTKSVPLIPIEYFYNTAVPWVDGQIDD